MGLYDVGDLLEKGLQRKYQAGTKSSVYWMLVICAVCSAITGMFFLVVSLFFEGDSGYAIAAGVFMLALVLSLSNLLNAKRSASAKDEKSGV